MHIICNIQCELLSIDIAVLVLHQIHQHIRMIISTFPFSHVCQHVQGIFIFGQALYKSFIPVNILALSSQITSPECPSHHTPSIGYCCPHLDLHLSWKIQKNYHHSWVWCHCHGYHHIYIIIFYLFAPSKAKVFAFFRHRMYTEMIIFFRHNIFII